MKIPYGKSGLTAVAFLLAIMIASPASAIQIHKRGYSPSVEPAWTIQAAVDEVIDDNGQYNGFRLTFGRQTSGNEAFRLNIDLAEKGPDFYENRLITTPDYGFTMRSVRGFDISSIGLSAEYLFYSTPEKRPRLYFGLGPMVSFEETGNEYLVHYDNYYDYVQSIDMEDSFLLGVGLSGAVGMEFFLGRNLSMLVEYGVSVQQKWFFFEADYYDQYGYHHTEVDSYNDGLDFGDSHIRLGFAAYFW